jgi:hypothetical protein
VRISVNLRIVIIGISDEIPRRYNILQGGANISDKLIKRKKYIYKIIIASSI